jgi:hypothetical protein
MAETVMQEAFDTYTAELIEDNLEDLVVFVMEPEDEHADVV